MALRYNIISKQLTYLTLVTNIIGASVIGSLCSGLLPLRFYNKLTGLILLILALQMAWNCIYPPKREIKDEASLTTGDKLKAMAYVQTGSAKGEPLSASAGGGNQPGPSGTDFDEVKKYPNLMLFVSNSLFQKCAFYFKLTHFFVK